MFGSNVIDTAIGLAFVYLLVSLACTALKEAIEVWWKKRSNLLQEGLARLMGESGAVAQPVAGQAGVAAPGVVAGPAAQWQPGQSPWLKKLYDQPLIQSLCRDWKTWPSYIPADLFARALISLVRKEGAQAPAAAPPAGVAGRSDGPAKDFLDLVDKLPNPALKETLRAVIGDASHTMEEVQADIESWFNGAMDRVSGWYKRWTQKVVFLLGTLIVIALNVDTLAIGRVLWADPHVRETVVVDARAALAKGAPPAEAPAHDATPKTATPDAAAKKTTPDAASKETRPDPLKGVKDTRAELVKLGLPVGWDPNDPMSFPTDGGGWLFKVLGLLISALAVSLGAPFWFDLLNKFMVIRSTVKPREKSPDEPPVDGPAPAPRNSQGGSAANTGGTR
ncbi:MAG TPA: hypothetical protein VH092_03430 [Urbifossiella sp.]|jgi:hypothetical protein|nr:hypothetical protein [Urbifossiella sp.]